MASYTRGTANATRAMRVSSVYSKARELLLCVSKRVLSSASPNMRILLGLCPARLYGWLDGWTLYTVLLCGYRTALEWINGWMDSISIIDRTGSLLPLPKEQAFYQVAVLPRCPRPEDPHL